MTTLAKSQEEVPVASQNVSNVSDTPWLLDIVFNSECSTTPDSSVVSGVLVQRCCQTSLQLQKLLLLDSEYTVEISVQLLDEPAMQTLNRQYRGKDAPTNVLSFTSEMPVMEAQFASEHFLPDEQLSQSAAAGYLALGDLVLCPAVIEREAVEQSKPLSNHWAHMLVHGTLHLCGYDHEEPGDAETMESLEIQILSELGLPDPYLEQFV